MKINHKLLLIFLEIALIPLTLLGFVAYSNAEKEITHQILLKLEAIADIQKNRFENLTKENLVHLDLLKSTVQTQITANIATSPPSPESQEKIQRLLNVAVKEIDGFKEISVLNLQGTVIASTTSKNIGTNKAQQVYFQKGKIANVVNLLSKDESGQVVLSIAGPLVLENKTIGVLAITSDGSDIFSIVSSYIGLGETGETLLVTRNQQGNVIFAAPTRKDPHAALNREISKEKFNITSVHAMNKEEKIFTNTQDYNGVPVFAVTRYIPSTDWGIVVKIDQQEAYVPTQKLQELLLFIISISVLITAGIAAASAQSITLPIKKLAAGVTQISQGNLMQKVSLSSKDEIGTLATAFNDMTVKLRSSYENLEQKVQTRTAELGTKVLELEHIKKAALNIMEDFHEEKEKLVHEKAKDEAILSSIGDGVFVIDLDEKIILYNKIAEQLTGYLNAEAIGKPYSDILKFTYEKDGSVNNVFIKKALDGHSMKMGNHTVLTRRDGNVVAVADSAAPIFNEARKVIGVVVVFRDVTKEREVDKMKSEFISLASHQLRTPLSAMKWNLEMLLGGDVGTLTKDQQSMTKDIDESNEHMIGLVNSLLNVTRIESGRIIVDPQPTNLGELAQGVIDEVKQKIDEKKQKLTLRVHDQLPDINIDPQLIRQVYMNLLTNAIKYTPEKREISVFISETDTEIISQVTDTGYGIPAKDKEKVFQKFYRGENIIKLVTDGNGLGMYLVKAIIDSSGGKIWFESTEGKGTSFWFSLPKAGMVAKAGDIGLDS